MGDDGLVLIFLAGRIGDGEGRVGLVLVVDVEFVVIGFLAVRPADGIAVLGLDVGRQGRRTVPPGQGVPRELTGQILPHMLLFYRSPLILLSHLFYHSLAQHTIKILLKYAKIPIF